MTWEIIEGDCLERMNEIPDHSIDAIIADPPYGTTACKWDSVIPFAPMWEQVKRIAKPKAAIVLFGSQPFTSALVMSNPGMFKYTWVWNKNNSAGFNTVKFRPFIITEDICIFGDGAVTYNPQMETRGAVRQKGFGGSQSECYGYMSPLIGERNNIYHPKNLINLSKINSQNNDHPTQKPVALMEYLIRTYTNAGDTVLDFTCGSGSTGVAAITTGRHFIGIEQSPEYCAISRQRLAAASQQPALVAGRAAVRDAARRVEYDDGAVIWETISATAYEAATGTETDALCAALDRHPREQR